MPKARKRTVKRNKNVPTKTTAKLEEANKLSEAEVIFITSNYRNAQKMRIRSRQQIASLGDRPAHPWTAEFADAFSEVEERMEAHMAGFVKDHPMSAWLLANLGIGPIISAELLAHINIDRAPTAGHIWSFAGLNPTQEWKAGQKRPWNPHLKTCCWYIGQSFMKVSGNPLSLYGQLYKRKKAEYTAKNEAGGYAERAKQILATKRFRKNVTRKQLEAGRLSLAHIDAMARRFAVKIFLSHFHLVWTWIRFKRVAPIPHVIAFGGHAHEIFPDHLDLVPGLAKALRNEGRLGSLAA